MSFILNCNCTFPEACIADSIYSGVGKHFTVLELRNDDCVQKQFLKLK